MYEVCGANAHQSYECFVALCQQHDNKLTRRGGAGFLDPCRPDISDDSSESSSSCDSECHYQSSDVGSVGGRCRRRSCKLGCRCSRSRNSLSRCRCTYCRGSGRGCHPGGCDCSASDLDEEDCFTRIC